MKYSIEQVVKKTGVSAFSLRNWEKRYQFLHPKRLNNGFRYYDEADVAVLKRVRELMEEGARIGDLAEKISKGEQLPQPRANQRREEASQRADELYSALKEGQIQKAVATWENLQTWVPVSRQVEWVLGGLFLKVMAEHLVGGVSGFKAQSILSFIRGKLISLLQVPLAEPHHFKEGHRKTALFGVLRTPEQSDTLQRDEVALFFRAWRAHERGRCVHFVEGGVSPSDVRAFLDQHQGVEAYLSAEPRFRNLLGGYGRTIHWVGKAADRVESLLGQDDNDAANAVTPASLRGDIESFAHPQGPDSLAG